MIDLIDLMLAPFCACVLLVGIHVYFGLHVIQRQIIFVDLAFAQVAALGATLGFLLGFPLHSSGSFATSLIATLLAAGLFCTTRAHGQFLLQEALIGTVYAVAAAASILVLSKTAEGGEELKSLMIGHLLFVSWEEIGEIFLVYILVGIINIIFREKFWKLSLAYSDKPAEKSDRRWDFLFYVLFGTVVTSSTELAGVLLVFSFLIVPGLCAALFVQSVRSRLMLGWGIGVLVSCAGLYLSYFFDLPTGATIVCVFGAALAFCLLIKQAF